MTIFLNPYAQGGWSNPHNQFQDGSESNPIPSIHGALPHIPTGSITGSDQLLTFRFEPQLGTSNSILNSVLMGPDSRPRFSITTSPPRSGADSGTVFPSVTSIKDEGGGLAATIEWQFHPVVQLKTYVNTVARQFTSQFLPLSQNPNSRSMVVNGKAYQWSRDPERDCVYFHNVSYSPREFLGFLSRGPDNTVLLNILPATVSEGLLDIAVLVAVIFYSNRNID